MFAREAWTSSPFLREVLGECVGWVLRARVEQVAGPTIRFFGGHDPDVDIGAIQRNSWEFFGIIKICV